MCEINYPEHLHEVASKVVVGTDLLVWQFEMSRRAGSTTESLRSVFYEITDAALAEALIYVEEHDDEITELIALYGPGEMNLVTEADYITDEEFECEMIEECERNAELYRRLAE